jgi:hypothetical protein
MCSDDAFRAKVRKRDTECGTMHNGFWQDIPEGAQESDRLAHRRVAAVAKENLIEWRRPGRGGSHVIFSAPGIREIVSVPAKPAQG